LRQDLPLYLHRTRHGAPLNTLVRLFVLHEPVELSEAGRALAPLRPEDGADLGLFHLDGNEVRSRVTLYPYQGLIAAADWPGETANGTTEVMGIAASSPLLAAMTIRRPVERMLDVGTGRGVQALLGAAHTGHVTGIDCNPRAVHFAAFNALLNGKANVAFLAGNLFEPVAGQVFDLIVCNPPFVIGPQASLRHSDSGLPGDEFCRSIVQAAPPFLSEGAYCQVVCNWAQTAGQDWKERLAGWLAGTGCAAWVL